MEQMESTETGVVSRSLADGKCPYLAGRPPHGTYKLWPSSINVCYGRPGDEKRYGHVGKDTQERQCFGGEGVYCECSHYQNALATSVAAPEFGRAVQPEEPVSTNDPMRRVKKRRRKKHRKSREWAPLLRTLVFCVTLIATVILVAMVLTR
jgi:hypothetical protein